MYCDCKHLIVNPLGTGDNALIITSNEHLVGLFQADPNRAVIMFKKLLCIGIFILGSAVLTGCTTQQQSQNNFSTFLKEYTQTAERGDTAKQLELGKMYLSGRITPEQAADLKTFYGIRPPYPFKIQQDFTLGVDWLIKAATKDQNLLGKVVDKVVQLDNSQVIFLMTDLILQNLLPPQETQRLIDTMRKLAKNDNTAESAFAAITVVNKLQNDYTDLAQGVILASQDQAPSQAIYGFVLLSSQPGQKDEGLAKLKSAADKGFSGANLYLCQAIISGLIKPDYPEQLFEIAYKGYQVDPFNKMLLITAANQLYVLNNQELDLIYGEYIKGELLDFAYSKFPFNSMALAALGSFGLQDRLNIDIPSGFKYAYQCADLGDKKCQIPLKKFEEDIQNDIVLAKKGDTQAKIRLMNQYFFLGDKGIPDHKKAVEYAQDLAKHNNPRAFMILSIESLCGDALPADFVKSIDYLQKAADYGDRDAKEILKNYQKTHTQPFATEGLKDPGQMQTLQAEKLRELLFQALVQSSVKFLVLSFL